MARTQASLSFTPVLHKEGFPPHFVCCKSMGLQVKVAKVVRVQVVSEGGR